MNHHDLPFMALYIASDTHTKFTSSSRSSQQQLNLVGSIGIPAGHASAPSELFVAVESSASALGSTSGRASGGSVSAPRPFADAFPRKESLASHRSSSSAGGTPGRASFSTSVGGGSSSVGSGITVTAADGAVCPWPVELALSSGQPILVEDCADLTSGFESRSWGDPISTALVIPVEAEESSHARCLVLIVGLNTRRPLDSDYHAWLSLIRLSLSSGLSGVASLEAQKERAEELARLDRAKTTFFSNVSHELVRPFATPLPLRAIADTLVRLRSANSSHPYLWAGQGSPSDLHKRHARTPLACHHRAQRRTPLATRRHADGRQPSRGWSDAGNILPSPARPANGRSRLVVPVGD